MPMYSNWITDNILATARPSKRIMDQYDIIEQFHENNIGAIINLQQAGEHKECGDGIINNEFSYTPEDFMRANIFYYNFGWKDMTVPPLELVLNIVQVMCFTLSQNKKVAIHCHAGLGRTGLVIACYLVYSGRNTAQSAVASVRLHRPTSIQTPKQVNFIKEFETFTRDIRSVYSTASPSLASVLTRQRLYLHGPEAIQMRHIPKILKVTCEQLSVWCNPVADSGGGGGGALLPLSGPEQDALAKYKAEVDEGDWLGTLRADGRVLLRMQLCWLTMLSPRLLHEGADAILAGSPPAAVTAILSESVLKSLSLLVTTLHKLAASSLEDQHTLYSTFARALVPFPKANTPDQYGQLLNAIAFLRDVNL